MSVLATPALPLHTAGKYVAAAYIVFFALILIYVAIMATRLNRIEREVGELLEREPPRHPELDEAAVEDAVAVSDARLADPAATVSEESAHV